MRNSYIYSLASPPRDVPLLLRLNVLFGGFSNQFGWLFLGFGMIFVWAFIGNSDLTSVYYFRGEIEQVEGKSLGYEYTNATEGGGKGRRGTPVYATNYTFVYDGAIYKDVSYATGEYFDAGQTVSVEIPKGNPKVSRIEGFRRGIFPPWVLFILIFPTVGLIFVLIGLKQGIKANRLLTNGRPALGRLKSKTPTNTRINNQTVYKYTFEFAAAEGGTHEVTAKTHLRHLLEDEAEERLLYDPYNPSYAVMMDALPGSPAVDSLGQFQVASVFRSMLVLIAPGITILGHGAFAYYKFFQ